MGLVLRSTRKVHAFSNFRPYNTPFLASHIAPLATPNRQLRQNYFRELILTIERFLLSFFELISKQETD